MIGFSIRNLKVFFKDKSAVFFSLLAVFIIIGLYALFLGDVWIGSFEGMNGVRFLMDSWIMAGVLAVTSVTTTMGAYGIIIEDRTRKRLKDFIVSPVKSYAIVSGYIISGILIGIIMSLITTILAEIYIVSYGGTLMNIEALGKVFAMIILATVANSSIMLFIVSFFKSMNAFSTASSIVGTLIGFITGTYLPIGNLPEAVQWVVKCFPVSYAASLFRQIMMEEPISVAFAGAPAEVVADFKLEMGVVIKFGDTIVSPFISVIILIITAILFYSLAIVNLSRKSS